MYYFTTFGDIFTAEKPIKIIILLLFGGAVFDGENAGILAKVLDEAFLRGGRDGLGFSVDIVEQMTDALIIEFGVDIIEQKQRIFTTCRTINFNVSELQKKQRAPLLPGRAKPAQLVAIEQDLEVVAMSADQRMP